MPRAALLILLLSISVSAALQAQIAPPLDGRLAQQGAQNPRELKVAPDAAAKTPEAKPNLGGQSMGGPANVCAELVAFMEKKAATPPEGSKPATDASKEAQDTKPGTQTAGPGQTAPPMDQAQQKSGISAPVPQDDKSTGTSQMTVEQAQKLAHGNDLRGCQGAVQEMRRAGMALPPGLLALAALREDLLAKSQPPNAPAAQGGQGAPAPQGPGAQ